MLYRCSILGYGAHKQPIYIGPTIYLDTFLPYLDNLSGLALPYIA